jgi:hypothetical protein
MRVVLDTNILVSALIAPAGDPAAIYNAWELGKLAHPDKLRRFRSRPAGLKPDTYTGACTI